jgi:hypothetical protein
MTTGRAAIRRRPGPELGLLCSDTRSPFFRVDVTV